MGIVTDPDADRLALVTNEGALFGEENTQAAAADFLLGINPGPAATNLSSSRVMDDVAKKHGQTCFRSPVGEIHVVKRMQEVKAVIGGEGNGGVINPDLHYGRDALVGVAMILQLLADRKISLAEYKRELPPYHITKQKIDLNGIDADELLQKAQKKFADFEMNTADGVKIDFEEGWVHLRKSNTEPIIRVYSEGSSPEESKELGDRVKNGVLGD